MTDPGRAHRGQYGSQRGHETQRGGGNQGRGNQGRENQGRENQGRENQGRGNQGRGKQGGPFELLGLAASAGVTDEDVRAAWRRIAAATHPDRPDGGDPPRFAAASAAYTTLRTRSGRGEALAEMAGGGGSATISPPHDAPLARQASAADALAGATAPGYQAPGSQAPGYQAPGSHAPGYQAPGYHLLSRVVTRVRQGRPAVLTVRLAIVAAVGAGSAALVGWAPATPALITGAVTWLLLTARNDLAPPG